MNILRFFLILLLAVFNAHAQDSARLWITEGFNQNILFEKEIPLKESSVMKILQDNAQVKTSFGGAFVTEINAIGSQKNKGWFYYVNGCLAQVGALGYIPKSGDKIWWDFHPWNHTVYISSVVGAYPEPFLSGCNETVFKTEIISTKGLWSISQRLLQNLIEKGVEKIELKEYTSEDISSTNATILIAGWEDLKNNLAIMDAVKNHQKSGFFVKFNEGKLILLDIFGKEIKSLDQASVILALGSGFTGSPPLWIVTGTDEGQVEKALTLLIEQPQKLKFHSGIVLSDGEIYNVPIQK